ncbi:AzlD domain-containing protein [Pseudonocardia sp. TRM90224]|uniref:AzlD domain-containing protein n=1 Tax=Pseudonocardia sp. TRM90224 TaxID=2812678 RepID=UPI001E641DC3|nr:AzlD domain-containing protein [Pseudonocardia sp. TRM90224]
MTDVWLTIVLLAVVSIGFRVVAPLVIGGRELPSRVRTALLDTGPALIAAMVVLLLWPAGDDVPMQHTLTALAGVAAGIVLLAARRSILTAMLVAAAVTALLRLLT